jgi:putative DNA primase/helicase
MVADGVPATTARIEANYPPEVLPEPAEQGGNEAQGDNEAVSAAGVPATEAERTSIEPKVETEAGAPSDGNTAGERSEEFTPAFFKPSTPEEQTRALWKVLARAGEVLEVRLGGVKKGPAHLWGKVAGYFGNATALVHECIGITGADAADVWITVNPVNPTLRARSYNRLKPGSPAYAADDDIECLRHLVVRIEAKRPFGVSATKEEVEAATVVAHQLNDGLLEAGLPSPAFAGRNGAGWELVYRLPDLDPTVENRELVCKALDGIIAAYATAVVEISMEGGRPGARVHVLGTLAAEGDNLAERPWRLTSGRFASQVGVLTVEQLIVLTDLGHRAPSADPVAQGIASIEVLAQQVQDAVDKRQAKAAIEEVMRNKAEMSLLVAAYAARPEAMKAAIEQIGDRHGLGGPAKKLEEMLKKQATRFRREAKQGDDAEGGGEGSMLGIEVPGIPSANRLVVPHPFAVTLKGGVVEVSRGPGGESKEKLICTAPLLITGRTVDVHSGTTSVRLTWVYGGRWHHRLVMRDHVADKAKILALARYDLPVHTLNAGGIVGWMAAFESANISVLPRARVSQVMGWVDGTGEGGFLWGSRLLRSDHPLNDQAQSGGRLDQTTPDTWQDNSIYLHIPDDDGGGQIVSAFVGAGSFEKWREAVKRCLPYPNVVLAIYAAIVPILMPFLPDAPNFIIDWSGETSRGKTTVLRIAASCWGRPDERAGGMLSTWDQTRVSIERMAALLGNLPFIIDDTKRARQPKVVSQVIYDFTSGKGRGRGSVDGMRQTGSWRTVMLSTGESAINSFTEDGGARARVIVLPGSPFGTVTDQTASLTAELNAAVLRHYGHAGPMIVLELHRRWPELHKLREQFQERHNAWLLVANGHPVASRMAAYFASLELAGGLVHTVLGIAGDPEGVLRAVWNASVTSMHEADPPKRALEQIRSWATSHQGEFWGRHQRRPSESESPQPLRGWAGAWDMSEDWPSIAFLPTRLDEILRELRHEPEGIIAAWARRGWLKRESGHVRSKVTIGANMRQRCVVIKREAFVEIGEDDESQSAPGEVGDGDDLL